MSLARIKDLCLDAGDHQALADWWCRVLGYARAEPDADTSSDDPVLLRPGAAGGLPLWVNRVPEPKTAKNRLHLDLQVSGGRHLDADKRTERIEAFAQVLVEAGGSVAYRSMQNGQLDHITMADPEGNELCVV
jgi:Glyoxalase-like domain